MHERYLGDGVYASHDGFQIWLAANNRANRVIALEPEVMQALIEYNDYINGLRKAAENGEQG